MAFTPEQLGGRVTLPQDTPATGPQAGVDAQLMENRHSYLGTVSI